MEFRLPVMLMLALAIIFLAGCTNPPIEPVTEKVDISVASLQLLNDSPVSLGSLFPVRATVSSDSPAASYTLRIMLDGDEVYKETFSGNTTIESLIPAKADGHANITAIVFLENAKNFTDTNVSNDVYTLPVHVLPYGNFTGVILQINKTTYYECNTSSTNYCRQDKIFLDVNNYTSIYDKRTYGLKLHFDSNTTINSIGLFVRRTFLFSPNSTIYYYIYPMINNTPSNSSIMNFSTYFFYVPDDWNLLLLARKSGQATLPPGDYVLELYVDEMSYADIACSHSSGSAGTFERTEPSPKRRWYDGPNCTANIIISSRNPLEAYKEYMILNNMEEAK